MCRQLREWDAWLSSPVVDTYRACLVHRMLRDDYYIGVVKWGGSTNPNGRHPHLIDVATFEKVQEVLDTARLSGNRTRKHKHYLRGSLFCGFCGRRLVFHRIRGRGGSMTISDASAIKVGGEKKSSSALRLSAGRCIFGQRPPCRVHERLWTRFPGRCCCLRRLKWPTAKPRRRFAAC